MRSQLLVLFTILILYIISYYILYFLSIVRFSWFRLLPSFYPVSVSFLVSLALLFLFCLLFLLLLRFLPLPFLFPMFLFLLYLYPLFIFFFPRFLLSFLRSSLLLLLFFRLPLLCSTPALSAISTPSLVDFLFLFSFSVPFFSSSSLGFPPNSAFLHFFLFSLLLSTLTISPLHLLFSLLLFLRRLLLRGFFLSSCFPPPLAVSSFLSPFLWLRFPFAWFFFFLWSNFSCSSSLCSFRFVLFCLFPYIYSLYSRSCVHVFLRSVVSFSFLFFSLLLIVSLRGFISFRLCSHFLLVSQALVTLLQGCLSSCFRLELSFSIRLLWLRFRTPEGMGWTWLFVSSVRFPEFMLSLWLY